MDSGHYTVRFDSLLLKEAVVEGDSVLPPLRTEPTSSSDSEGSDMDDASYARGRWRPALNRAPAWKSRQMWILACTAFLEVRDACGPGHVGCRAHPPAERCPFL